MLIYKLNIPLIFLHKGALCVAKIAVMRRMIHTKKRKKNYTSSLIFKQLQSSSELHRVSECEG